MSKKITDKIGLTNIQPSSISNNYVDSFSRIPYRFIPDVMVQIGNFSIPTEMKESSHRWTVPKDGVLVSAWLNTNKDAVVGNEQKAGAFWKWVAAYYAASPTMKDLSPREWNTCKQRWGIINEAVKRFFGFYEQAGRQNTIGQSKDDIFEMAYNFYFRDQRSNFTYEHVWGMLRNYQN
ncbi:unnamed protein product [Microthlaspi erraticum]|uniref:Myb-like domain-containing protein n=1 Tax=Microthlaspi erraticum TaxID=1685480 RepID=A0A6D2KRX5_9BRAS|nr:unnamed protein product [Microthlaspi erraticum]